MTFEVLLSAWVVLLSNWGQRGQWVKNVQQQLLLGQLLAEARLLFAVNWKSEKIPTKDEWLQKVQYVCLMDKISGLG